MPLDIHVEAEPESLFGFASWLRDAGGRVGFWAGAGPRQARAESEHGWTGPAAEGFQAVAYRLASEGDLLDDAWVGFAQIVEGHAHDIQAVRIKMGDAREIAMNAGLCATMREIPDPGPPPPKPQAHSDLDSGEEALEKACAWRAWRDWNEQAEAYTKCATLVTEARRIEQDSQNNAIDIIKGMANAGSIITAASFLNGLAAGYITRQQSWRGTAQSFTNLAEEARQAAGDPAHGAPKQAKNLLLGLVKQAGADVAEARANTNHIGRWLERLPEPAKDTITRQLGQFIPDNATYLKKAPEVLKRISVVGGGLSGLSTGFAIAGGKDPATAVTSNGLGLLGGTATGMAVGGPFGAVAAFIVGTGTTIAVDDGMTPDPEDKMIIAPEAPSIQQTNNPPR